MKILVFNSELMIKDSIEAMIKEDIYCGLLWDSNANKYIGIFTIRDVLSLIMISYQQLNQYLNSNTNINDLDTLIKSIVEIFSKMTFDKNKMDLEEEEKIDTTNYDKIIKNFSDFFKLFDNFTINDYVNKFKDKNQNMISIYLDGNLQDCIKLIRDNHIHRIVVEDQKSNTITGFITYEAIFEFFIENYYSSMKEFEIQLKDVNIISKNVFSLKKDDNLCKAMELFCSKKISLIPIMDDKEILGYIYLKDIIYCFSNGNNLNFNTKISAFLEDLYEGVDSEKPYGKKRITQLEETTDLKKVFEEMSICPERKLVVKYEDHIGIITLSNIFTELVD
jgi:predicted transcriptional regulator